MAKQDGRGSFEQRLQSARTRQGLDPVAKPGRFPAFDAWSLGTRVGVEMLASLVVGTAIGIALDYFCHTSPVFLMIGVPLGGAAGILNVWRVMGPRKQ